MKIFAVILAVFFSMTFCAPVFAEDVAAKDLCDPQKIEECKAEIDALINSIDSLRANLVKTKMELNTGRKLTNEEADRLLKNLQPIERSIPTPTTEGFMWDN